MPWAKKSVKDTKAMHFADRRSWVGTKSDGTLYMRCFGKDMAAMRRALLSQSGGRCAMCHVACLMSGEVDHVLSRGKGGDDSLANLQFLCRDCHRKKHVQVKWSKRKGEAA